VCLFVCAFAYFIIFHIYSHDFLAFYARARAYIHDVSMYLSMSSYLPSRPVLYQLPAPFSQFTHT